MKKIIHRIKNIRQEPEHVRRHVLYGMTAVCGILLLSLWVYSLGRDFTSEETQANVSEGLKPLSALKDNFVGGYKSILNPVPEAEE